MLIGSLIVYMSSGWKDARERDKASEELGEETRGEA